MLNLFFFVHIYISEFLGPESGVAAGIVVSTTNFLVACFSRW